MFIILLGSLRVKILSVASQLFCIVWCAGWGVGMAILYFLHGFSLCLCLCLGVNLRFDRVSVRGSCLCVSISILAILHDVDLRANIGLVLWSVLIMVSLDVVGELGWCQHVLTWFSLVDDLRF